MTKLSHTDDGLFEPFSLNDEKPKEFEIKQNAPDWAIPYLSSQEAWDNYSDDLVYETDKRIREWLESMKNKWSKKGSDRRFTFSSLIEILGIDVRVKAEKNYQKISRVFAYYSTKIQKQTTINGIKHKNVYTVSAARLKRPPYSLKLRMEQFDKPVTWRSLRLPKDNLEPGHARNKRTEENMKRRSEEARRRANEYKERWKSASETRQEGTS